MKKKNIHKCHICLREMRFVSIGRHYKYAHSFDLSNSENYKLYFNFNYPTFIDTIIKECNAEKKSINVLLKEKYNEIGEGTINRLQKLLKNEINVSKIDIEDIRTKKREATTIERYGDKYSKEFRKRMGGFKDKLLAKTASKKAKENNKLKEFNLLHFKSDEFKKKRRETLLKKYGSLIIKAESTSKWHLKVRNEFIECGIITEHEKNVLKNYIVDEFDRNKGVCIELNGDFWHCNPKIFDEDYVHPIIKLNAKEIWERDKKKYDQYKENGYDVFIIWESDDLKHKINEYKLRYGYSNDIK